MRKTIGLLSQAEKRQAFWLLGPMIITALLEVVGIALVMPFMSMVISPSSIDKSTKLQWIFQTFHFQSTHQFLMYLGGMVLFVLLFGNLISAVTQCMVLRFANTRNYTLSYRLFAKYLFQPYRYFLQHHTASLSKNILAQVNDVVNSVLVQGMQMLARLCAIICILGLLLFVNPLLALVVGTLLGGVYAGIYLFIRRKLTVVSREIVVAQNDRFKIASESFSAIKEVKLHGCEHDILDRFAIPAEKFAQHMASISIYSSMPKYVLETIAFGGIMMIVLWLLATQSHPSEIIAILALYTFAGYRLMPSVQQVFAGTATIKGHMVALNELCQDLHQDHIPPREVDQDKLLCHDHIQLKNITFAYGEKNQAIISDLTLNIPANTTVGLVGATGAGKTTIAHLIMGLLEADQGTILVDDIPICPQNIRRWQRNIGYVPQHIFLLDDTIETNIAFGVPKDAIDHSAVKRAAKLADIHSFIEKELPSGYQTQVGERGVRLSGGQIQRVAIARALYQDQQVLVFDEATSALDGITENAVMSALHNLSHQKTMILIAHRLSTLSTCDQIFFLSEGKVIERGTYKELIANNAQFREMANVQ